MNNNSFNIFSNPSNQPVDIFSGTTPELDIFSGSTQEVNIFANPQQTMNNIFGSTRPSANVDIFSNNARAPADVAAPVDIFSQESTANIDIFAATESQEVNIFGSSEEHEVNIFGTSTTNETDINSLFESLSQTLRNEDLDNIASLVDVAKDIYVEGV